MFNVHYISDTKLYHKANKQKDDPERLGEIISYQEGPDVTHPDDLELGTDVLTFPTVISILDPDNYKPNVRVDTVNKKLIYKDPPQAIQAAK